MKLLRTAAALVLFGLAVELVSLGWAHPLAFLLFAIVGGASVMVGILLYLYWLLVRREASS
jgi:hypothetical protein